MKIIGMVPARIGSKRLAAKNLKRLQGRPLLAIAVQKCLDAGVFDEIWVNADDPAFERIAVDMGVRYHPRPAHLADDNATSEEYVQEFLEVHPCDLLVQVHSIAPVIGHSTVARFVEAFRSADADVMLSVVHEPLECLYEGRPVNFSMASKQNSQDLRVLERITWGLTGWRRSVYLDAAAQGRCATWYGRIATFPLTRFEGHVIKTEEDLQLAECMLQAPIAEHGGG